jgi:glycosyltransferase involved in cell wall biosynthesis
MVPPRDPDAFAAALRKLVQDADLRQRMGHRAREHVLSRFSVERLLDDVAALYEELLADRHLIETSRAAPASQVIQIASR